MREENSRPWQGAAVGADWDVNSNNIVPAGWDSAHLASRDEDERQMVRYLDLLHGDSVGYVVVGVGVPVLRDDKYRLEPFHEIGYALPDDRSRLVKASREAVEDGKDVFITPLLRSAPSRAQGRSEPLPGRFVWLDIDDFTSAVEGALRELGLPCHLVDSGGLGRPRHGYLDTGTRLPGAEVATLAAKLREALGGKAAGVDLAGGDNKYLRLPGTVNHKGLLLADGARSVRWLSPLHPGAPSSLEVLESFLTQRSGRTARSTRRSSGPRQQRDERPTDHLPVREAADSDVRDSADGDVCEKVWFLYEEMRKALTEGSWHGTLRSVLMRLARAEQDQHRGARIVLPRLEDEFIAAAKTDRGGEESARTEFLRALRGTMLNEAYTEQEFAVCSCVLADLQRSLDDPGLFTPRGRRTERKVLQSLIREAQRRGSRRVSKSQRQIAEDADCSQRAVVLALRRLQSQGLIEQRVGKGRAMPHLVLARPRKSDSTFVRLPAGKEVESLPRVGPTHPLFGSAGLRGNQELTFSALDEYRVRFGMGHLVAVKGRHGLASIERRREWRDIARPSGTGGRTPALIAQATGQQVATVRNHLRQMHEREWVTQVDGLWFRLAWDPSVEAEDRGVAGVPEARRQRHRAERVRFYDRQSFLPADDKRHVGRQDCDGIRTYFHPKNGQVMWQTPVPSNDQAAPPTRWPPQLLLSSEGAAGQEAAGAAPGASHAPAGANGTRADSLDTGAARVGAAPPRAQDGLRHLEVLEHEDAIERFMNKHRRASYEDVAPLLLRVGSDLAPTVLFRLSRGQVLPQPVLAAAVIASWSAVDYPEQALGREGWLRLFSRSGYTVDGVTAPRPKGNITLYRGASFNGRHGLAWTRDASMARSFARHHADQLNVNTVVLECSVPPTRLLADPGTYGQPGEQEILADVVGRPRRVLWTSLCLTDE